MRRSSAYGTHTTHTEYCNGCRCAACRRAHAIQCRIWNAANKDKIRISKQRKNLKQYGLSLEAYHALLLTQGRTCALCRQPCRTRRQLAVDHDHETGTVRGLLCYSCNVKLGWYEKWSQEVDGYLDRRGTCRITGTR